MNNIQTQNQFPFTLQDIKETVKVIVTEAIYASEKRLEAMIDLKVDRAINELAGIVSNGFTRVERRLDHFESDMEEIKKDRLASRLSKVEVISSDHSTYFKGVKKALQTA